MQVTASSIIYDERGALDHQGSCAFTSVYLAHDFTLYVSGRWGNERNSLNGHPCAFASMDRGDTWEKRYEGHDQWDWDGLPGENKDLICTELTPGELIATSLLVDRSQLELPCMNQ